MKHRLVNMTPDAAWTVAQNYVDYPVHIVPLYYDATDIYHHIPVDDVYSLATGNTNTDRDVQFYGIVVDKNNDGALSTIATVTGQYATLNTKEVYGDLKNDLADSGVQAQPVSVYVSGSGGSHQLTVEVDDMESPVLGIGKIKLAIQLNTSVDGSKKHEISMTPVNDKGVQLFGVSSSYNLTAKHTKTIGERHVAFSTVINKMITDWNTTIVPMMLLLDGTKFEYSMAMGILEQLMEDSNIPEKHSIKVTSSIEQSHSVSALQLLNGVSEYFDDACSDKPERLESFKKSVNKHAMKIIKRYIKD